LGFHDVLLSDLEGDELGLYTNDERREREREDERMHGEKYPLQRDEKVWRVGLFGDGGVVEGLERSSLRKRLCLEREGRREGLK